MASQVPPEPLRQYSLLADGERGALVGPRGDVCFLCAPRWHDDAVFSGLLGGRSNYTVMPQDEHFVWGGYYEEDSLVWHSRWITTTRIIECREALAFPGDPRRLVLLRRVLAVDGEAPVTVHLDARAGFDAEPMRTCRSAAGTWEGRTGGLHLRWSGLEPGLREQDGGLGFDLVVPAGTSRDLVLEIADEPFTEPPPDAAELWEETARAWQDAMPDLAPSVSPAESRHSYAVLRGLTSSAGGMVAAATTALPERAEQHRDYDYRYAWVRDQCFAGMAAAAAGGTAMLDASVRFVTDRLLADGSDLRPAYTVDGDRLPAQRRVDLPGYPGAPANAGNRAGSQFQLDAFGESLALLGTAAARDRLDADGWRAVETAVAAIEERQDSHEAGIWELEPRWWTHSRLACAGGLRSVARCQPDASAATRWERLADGLVAEARRRACHPDGYWQRSPQDPLVDAALLVPPLRGAVPADDPLTRGTIRAVVDQLADDGYVYRFRHDQRPLHEAEGAFLLSGFHLAMALDQQGDRPTAMRWFERSRSALGPPGLFTEEFDVVQRQLRGNLPQAFVHGALLESAARLATPDSPAPGFWQRERRREEG